MAVTVFAGDIGAIEVRLIDWLKDRRKEEPIRKAAQKCLKEKLNIKSWLCENH